MEGICILMRYKVIFLNHMTNNWSHVVISDFQLLGGNIHEVIAAAKFVGIVDATDYSIYSIEAITV